MVGSSERVGLPFMVDLRGRFLADQLLERGLVGEKLRNAIGKVFADADAADRLDGIGRNCHGEKSF